MEFNLTKESMELLVEQIVDAVESSEDRDTQFDMVKTILTDNGIVEIEDTDLTQTNTNRIDSIKAYKIQVEQEKIDVQNKEKAEREKLIAKIQELQPRISELIDTANACIENDIEIDKYHKYLSRCYDSWENGTFVTNGITHNIGFVQIGRNPITEMGIDAGGFCGVLDFRVDGRKVYSLHETDKTEHEPKNEHMKQFLNDFDKFEEAFYSYVDKTINRGKQR